MAPRIELQALLESLLGTRNVYFQAPPTNDLNYPCIIYKRANIDIDYAGNKPYSHKTRYLITVIDPDPDSDIHKLIGELPTAAYDRSYAADQLNHDVYRLFF